MTAEPTIDYEALAQEAMRGVVRAVLIETAKNGLPGDHHFYISFDTEASGVGLSKRLKAKYPSEMTVVLQHRFWDLNISEDRFEVKLTFDGIPERLVVPFAAIKVFFDPSVRYGLQFDDPDFNAEAVDESMTSLEHNLSDQEIEPDLADDAEPTPTVSRSSSPRKRSGSRRKFEPRVADSSDTREPEDPGHAASASASDDVNEHGESDVDLDEHDEENAGGAEIVSLDAFRKK